MITWAKAIREAVDERNELIEELTQARAECDALAKQLSATVVTDGCPACRVESMCRDEAMCPVCFADKPCPCVSRLGRPS